MKKEMISDGLFVLGCTSVVIGVGLLFGLPLALVVGGLAACVLGLLLGRTEDKR